MKKKVILIVCIALALLLLIPIPMRLKDGGSVVYTALLYKLTKVHSLNTEDVGGYTDGLIVEVLGMEIFNNVK